MSGESLSPTPPNVIKVKDKSCDRGTWKGPDGERLTWWEKMADVLRSFGCSPEKIIDYKFIPDNQDAYKAAGGHDQPGTIQIKLKK